MNNKLPKQINHWINKVGLRPYKRSYTNKKNRNAPTSYKGKGCWWRFTDNSDGEPCIQVGEIYQTFDRWGNSGLDMVKVPSSLKEFRNTVNSLSNDANDFHLSTSWKNSL